MNRRDKYPIMCEVYCFGHLLLPKKMLLAIFFQNVTFKIEFFKEYDFGGFQ
jgi:hypothetical protein